MIEPPPVDRSAGMEVYASYSLPCWARMKTSPEDFVVEEVLGGLKLLQEPTADMYPIYRVEKRLLDTFHLERELSKALQSKVKFVGLKDKRAVSVQYATPTSKHSRRPQLVDEGRFRAELVGYSPRPISGADVTGNRFGIMLRGCCADIGSRVEQVIDLARDLCLPNFFGLQRFGSKGALTHRVGAAMIKGRFEEAVRILLCEPRGEEGPNLVEARELMRKGNYREGARLLGNGSDIERLVANRLAERPSDFLGGLRAVPIKLRRFYPQAYQSYVFNRALSLALVRGLDISKVQQGDNWGDVTPDGLRILKVHGTKEAQDTKAVPLFQMIGYSYRNYGSRFDACTQEILDQEGVTAREFFLPEMQEVSTEGGFRRPHMVTAERSYKLTGGDLALSFILARGQYATVLVREIVKPQDPFAQGFA
jgi:tRNA pseudouridine13 synthase